MLGRLDLDPSEHSVLHSARIHVDNDQVMPQHERDVGEEDVVRKYSWHLVVLGPSEWVYFHEAVVNEAICPGS